MDLLCESHSCLFRARTTLWPYLLLSELLVQGTILVLFKVNGNSEFMLKLYSFQDSGRKPSWVRMGSTSMVRFNADLVGKLIQCLSSSVCTRIMERIEFVTRGTTIILCNQPFQVTRLVSLYLYKGRIYMT